MLTHEELCWVFSLTDEAAEILQCSEKTAAETAVHLLTDDAGDPVPGFQHCMLPFEIRMVYFSNSLFSIQILKGKFALLLIELLTVAF